MIFGCIESSVAYTLFSYLQKPRHPQWPGTQAQEASSVNSSGQHFFFPKRSSIKYVRLCRLSILCYSYSVPPLQHKSSHRQYINKLVCLCFNKTWFIKNRQQARLEQKAVHSQLLVYHIVPRAQCCPYRLVGPKTWAEGAGSKRNLFHYYSLKYKKHTPSGSQLTKKKTDC